MLTRELQAVGVKGSAASSEGKQCVVCVYSPQFLDDELLAPSVVMKAGQDT